MGDCLSHITIPEFNWFGEETTKVMSKCRRCTERLAKGGGSGDSWPLLRQDSQELFTAVKWTKKQLKGGDDRRGSFTRCHSDPGWENGGNPLHGEGDDEESDLGLQNVQKCSSSSNSRICNNRAESMDFCTCSDTSCDESSEPECEQGDSSGGGSGGGSMVLLSSLSPPIQNCKYCSTGEDSDYFWDAETSFGEKENDQQQQQQNSRCASSTPRDRGMKSFEVLQKMSSQCLLSKSFTLLAGGEMEGTETGNDSAAILSLDSPPNKKHVLKESPEDLESTSHLLFHGSF